MSRLRLCLVAGLVLGLALSLPAWAVEKTPDVIVEEASLVLKEMAASGRDKGFPVELIKGSAGVAIFPGMIKGGVIVGGAYGKGVILAHDKGQWNGPAFLEISAGSIGLQVGVESMDLILVIKNERGLKSFLASKFKLGADLGVAAGPVGASATAATDAQLKAEIYTYSRSKGLYAGVSLEGAGISSLPTSNKEYYGDVSHTEEILAGQGKTPASGLKLIEILKEMSK